MCYLIAKDRDAHGCFALKTTHGRHLVELKRELNRAIGYKGVQLVTISRPTAYGEYSKGISEEVKKPKALGDIRGVSYIYPVLWRFGLIRVPEAIEKKMGK